MQMLNENDKKFLSSLYDIVDEYGSNFNFYISYTYHGEYPESRKEYNDKMEPFLKFDRCVNCYLSSNRGMNSEFRRFVERFTVKINGRNEFRHLYYKCNLFMIFIKCLYTLNLTDILNNICTVHAEEYKQDVMFNLRKIRHYINWKVMERILQVFQVVDIDLLYYIVINGFRMLVYQDQVNNIHNLLYRCLSINLDDPETVNIVRNALTEFYTIQYPEHTDGDDEDIEEYEELEPIENCDYYRFMLKYCDDPMVSYILDDDGFYATDKDCNRGQFYRNKDGLYYDSSVEQLINTILFRSSREYYMPNIPDKYK